MEPASSQDLERASKQGTLLRIKVDGKIYGQGGFHADDVVVDWTESILIGFGVLIFVGFIYLMFANLFKKDSVLLQWIQRFVFRRRVKKLREPLREPLKTEEGQRMLLRGAVPR